MRNGGFLLALMSYDKFWSCPNNCVLVLRAWRIVLGCLRVPWLLSVLPQQLRTEEPLLGAAYAVYTALLPLRKMKDFFHYSMIYIA